MSNFKIKKISSKIIAIVDIWSYKIKVWICEYKNDKINLLWFSEKRQSSDDIINNEIINLEWVCENIELAIIKAEKEANKKVSEIVINPVFSETIFYTKNISHVRKDSLKLIDEPELEKIIYKIEEIWFFAAQKIIEKKYNYNISDFNIILSSISEIKIDKEKYWNILWKSWEKLSFHLLNIFISNSNLELINYIWKYLDKKIVKILPEEYCLAKIWDKKQEMVIINIWNSSSFITIKNNLWNIIWSIKIEVWIWSLIKKIQKVSNFSRINIIKKIDRDDFFKKEKQEFLEIFSFIISESLKEILETKICPNKFFIVWWWWNNDFLKNYLEKFNFSKTWIKIKNKINFIIPDVNKIAKIENIENILNKSNLNLISMILTYQKIINHKTDIIEKLAEKSINKLSSE